MPVTIQAHSDGDGIMPEKPARLSVRRPLSVTLKLREPDDVSEADSEAALKWFTDHGVHGVHIPDEALRRENIYDDRV